jgi:hypothetical protein
MARDTSRRWWFRAGSSTGGAGGTTGGGGSGGGGGSARGSGGENPRLATAVCSRSSRRFSRRALRASAVSSVDASSAEPSSARVVVVTELALTVCGRALELRSESLSLDGALFAPMCSGMTAIARSA